MPYVKNEDKVQYIGASMKIEHIPEIKTKGDLEFLISQLQDKFMQTREIRYSTLHDCAYATIHAGEEFKRRFLDGREDEACKENGDVFKFHKQKKESKKGK